MSDIANTKISVCLCTYNGAAFLAKQLDSILHQTLLPDEIIAVDDVSSDATMSILKDYEAKNPGHFHVFQNEHNLGYKKNFAKALALSEGGFIFFADQDDVWVPNKIESFMGIFEANPKTQCVCCTLTLIDENDDSLGMSSLNKGIRHLAKANKQWQCFAKHPLIPGTAMAVRRSLVASYSPLPEGFPHDEWYSFCASIENGIDVIDVPLVAYRQHSNQAIGDKKKSLSKHLSSKGPFSALIAQYGPFCDAQAAVFPEPVKKMMQDRNAFFSCRNRLQNESVLRSLGDFFLHPYLLSFYHRFAAHPFKSLCLDILMRSHE
jgi:glycosyltransferase involved in cell wall biosynthesis